MSPPMLQPDAARLARQVDLGILAVRVKEVRVQPPLNLRAHLPACSPLGPRRSHRVHPSAPILPRSPSISNAPSVSSMPSCGKGGKAGKGSKKSGKAKGESSECSGKGSKRGKGKSKSKKGEKNDLELDLSRTDHITNFDAGLATSSTTPRYMLTSVLTWQSVAFVALAMQTFFV